MSQRLLELLDSWELLQDGVDLAKYPFRDWTEISERLAGLYATPEPSTLGAVHLGVNAGSAIVEGRRPLADLAIPLLTSEKVYLPDPLYSFMAPAARKLWNLLPESGSHYFGGRHPHTNWQSLWDTPPADRPQRLRKMVPTYLEQLRQLRPLISSGAITLTPWEPGIFDRRADFRDTVRGLVKNDTLNQLTRQFPQDCYNLGARLGAIGVRAKDDFLDGRVRKNEGLFIADKTPIIITGLANAYLSTSLSASFVASLPGDRVVHDFVRAGCRAVDSLPMAERLALPKLSDAVWHDIVAIRNNDACVAAFRGVLSKAAGMTEEQALPALSEELRDAAARLAEEASVWKRVKNQTIDIGISAFVPGAATVALGAPILGVALGAATGAIRLLTHLTRAQRANERREAKVASELLIQVADRI